MPGSPLFMSPTRYGGGVLADLPAQTVQVQTVTTRPRSLKDVRSWVYQLQGFTSAEAIAALKVDLAVVDLSRTGQEAGRWTAAEVARMKRNKLLLAYLSIGEAENYRGYWQPGWAVGKPAFLYRADPDARWAGNYVVDYRDPAWQAVMIQEARKLQAAGFDGLYLDLVDAYQYFPEPQQGVMKSAMLDFIGRIRAAVPGMLIVTQDASELVEHEGGRLLGLIDGSAQEELWVAAMNRRQPARYIRDELDTMKTYQAAGKPVFVVNYATDPTLCAWASAQARAAGMVPYCAGDQLNQLWDLVR